MQQMRQRKKGLRRGPRERQDLGNMAFSSVAAGHGPVNERDAYPKAPSMPGMSSRHDPNITMETNTSMAMPTSTQRNQSILPTNTTGPMRSNLQLPQQARLGAGLKNNGGLSTNPVGSLSPNPVGGGLLPSPAIPPSGLPRPRRNSMSLAASVANVGPVQHGASQRPTGAGGAVVNADPALSRTRSPPDGPVYSNTTGFVPSGGGPNPPSGRTTHYANAPGQQGGQPHLGQGRAPFASGPAGSVMPQLPAASRMKTGGTSYSQGPKGQHPLGPTFTPTVF